MTTATVLIMKTIMINSENDDADGDDYDADADDYDDNCCDDSYDG